MDNGTRLSLVSRRSACKATGRHCTKGGAILDVQTAVALHDEINGLDERFSTLLKDKDIQRLLMKRVIELGIE